MEVEYFESKKAPSEVIPITFDFTALLPLGIDSVETLSISVVNGADPDTGTMKVGVATIQNSVVTQLIQNGLSGVKYLITCLVVYGQIKFQLGGYLVVEDLS